MFRLGNLKCDWDCSLKYFVIDLKKNDLVILNLIKNVKKLVFSIVIFIYMLLI